MNIAEMMDYHSTALRRHHHLQVGSFKRQALTVSEGHILDFKNERVCRRQFQIL